MLYSDKRKWRKLPDNKEMTTLYVRKATLFKLTSCKKSVLYLY